MGWPAACTKRGCERTPIGALFAAALAILGADVEQAADSVSGVCVDALAVCVVQAALLLERRARLRKVVT
jgi:hypothetical protein